MDITLYKYSDVCLTFFIPAANPVLLSIRPGAIDLRAAINTGVFDDIAD